MTETDITILNPEIIRTNFIRDGTAAMAAYDPADESTFDKIPWMIDQSEKSWYTDCLPWRGAFAKIGVNVYYGDKPVSLDTAKTPSSSR